MSFRFNHNDNIATAARRVAEEYIARAEGDLGGSGQELHAGIHDARKCLKKLRALLRLLRGPLGDIASQENQRCRTLGQALAPLRDASAMLETVDDLRVWYEAQMKAAPFQQLRSALEQRRERLFEEVDQGEAIVWVRSELAVMAAGLDDWPLPADQDPHAFTDGLQRSYRRGRKALAAVHKCSDGENVHEWRKRTKYLWYELRLLRDSWKPVLKRWCKQLDRLGDLLGDHHDCVVMAATIDAIGAEALGGERHRQALQAVVAARAGDLLSRALPIGERVWFESPGDFTDRMAAYWTAWKRPAQRPLALTPD